MSPETLGVEDEFRFGMAYVQGLCWFQGAMLVLGSVEIQYGYSCRFDKHINHIYIYTVHIIYHNLVS